MYAAFILAIDIIHGRVSKSASMDDSSDQATYHIAPERQAAKTDILQPQTDSSLKIDLIFANQLVKPTGYL